MNGKTGTSLSPRRADSPSRAVEAAVAEHWTALVASLIRVCGGDFQLAEDALQEAVISALEHWPDEGTPLRPEAWLFTAARRKAIDRLRRDQTLARKHDLLQAMLQHDSGGQDMDPPGDEDAQFRDDKLRLIFTCCHPALALEAQIALTLRVVCGLGTPEIAHAFLVPTETMAKRLTRARSKIRDARIPYRVPAAHELPARLGGVLSVIYLVFNEGYLGAESATLLRTGLCDEAVRLGRLLASLMPDEPEVLGLTALMLLNDSRRGARTDAQGNFQTLEEQDRSLWDQERIEEGCRLLDRCSRLRQPGPYQFQAAIAALHARPETPEETDWVEIAALYGRLMRLQPTPIVALNRAAAVAMAYGYEQGLRLIDQIDAEGSLAGYYLLPAARADLLRRAGRLREAATAYERALALCRNQVERAYLERRLREVRG